ncbi:MAG: glutamate 5-kinase, partial [Prevotellaceae bacterium]|nr:glutamate 5-kinase [Prevotellaceae bacterium]
LVLLSNVDGLYSGNPADASAELIREVGPDDDLSRFVQGVKSEAGRGGMASKYTTARKVAAAGIRVIIANGTVPDIIVRLFEKPRETPHTLFVPVQGA